MDDVIFDANDNNLFISNQLEGATLKFDVSIKTSKLTKIYHYASQQQQIYDIVKDLKENKGYGYRRISYYLMEKGYRSIRSKKPLLNNYVYSIYKKGKIREERINREFQPYLNNVSFYKN